MTGLCLAHVGHKVTLVDFGAHAAVLVSEWEELRALDLKKAAWLMGAPKLLVDGRNTLDPESVWEAGLLYRGFGRG